MVIGHLCVRFKALPGKMNCTCNLRTRGTGWWFGTFFIFPYIGNNHPKWLSYLSEGLKPPTRYDSMIDNIVIEMIVITYNEILNIYMTYGWHMKIRFTYFDQHCVWTMSWFKMLYDCVRLTTGYLGRAKLVILRIQAFIFGGKIDGVNDATRRSRATCYVSELFSLSGWWSWDVRIVIQAAPNFGCKDVGCEVGCLQPDFDF